METKSAWTMDNREVKVAGMDRGAGEATCKPQRANGAEAGRRAAKPVTSCRPLAGTGGCQHRNPGHNCGQMAILDHSPSVRRSTAPERSSERLHARAADPACDIVEV